MLLGGSGEMTVSAPVAASCEYMRIDVGMKEAADEFDAGSGIFQMVEAKFKEGGPVFIFAFRGFAKLGGSGKPQGNAEARKGMREPRHLRVVEVRIARV